MAHDAQGSGGGQLLIYIAIALICFAGGYIIGNKGGQSTTPGAAVEGTAATGAAANLRGAVAGDSTTIPIGDSPVFGNVNAPITVVEFSSFQCPFCARGADTIKQLQQKYPNDVKLVFKHYPLGFQAESPALSKAALAAQEQGKFWEMKEMIFKNVSAHKGVNVKEVTAGYAQQLGLDVNKFKQDFDKPSYDEIIKRDTDLGNSIGVRGTPHFFINGERMSGAQPLAKFEEIVKAQLEDVKKHLAAGVAKDQIYAKMVSEKYAAAPAPQAQQPPAAEATVVNMVPVRADDPAKGAKDYLVTIVAFSDFQCPFCSRGASTIEEVLKEYDGKVQLVFKAYPLPFHQEAPAAHRAALAAGKQGKFWEMHDKLFATTKDFKTAGHFEKLAQELGLNMQKFNADFNSEELKKQVDAEMAEGTAVGVRGTPAFFINGNRVVGAQPLAKFKEVIDAELKNKK